VRAATLAVAGQQITAPTPPAGLQFGLQLKATTGLASLAAGDCAYLSQPVEGYRAARLALGGASACSISVGFWVYATIAGTMAVALTNGAANRSIVKDIVINNAATWEYKTVTFGGDTAGAWLATNGVGLDVRFCFGAGSNWQTSAGAWTGAEKFATSATTNFMASTNNVGVIAGVVVLPGVELPSSDRSALLLRPFPDALRDCQRYWWSTFLYGTSPAQNVGANTGELSFNAISAGAVTQRYDLRMPAPMRVDPTATLFNPAAANAQIRDFTNSADCSLSGVWDARANRLIVFATGNAATTVNASLRVHVVADARL
jgi:hypothetical protein